MKRNKNIILLFCLLVITSKLFGAYLEKVPQTLKQPNGVTINCFATGDEFYSWLYDANNYTIIQDSITGYYCYAIIQNNKLVASNYIVGVADPATCGLSSGVNLSNQQIANITNTLLSRLPLRQRWLNSTIALKATSLSVTRAINNIVVYIRFADDQNEFPSEQSKYSSYFNDAETGQVSMYNYFNEISYGQTNIQSTFYPNNNGTAIISYKDAHIRNYYRPYSVTNDSGYCEIYPCYTDREYRENALVMNALDYIKSQIPAFLNLDENMDGYVDNICFIIKGSEDVWNKILWPHAGMLAPYTNYSINSKFVRNYNFQFESNLDVEVLCHEMCHTLGAPDMYHYVNTFGMLPIGTWDIMCLGGVTPVSTCIYTKNKYLGFVSDIPIITNSGHYTLQSITSSTNNCYKISSSNQNEFFVLEFRQKTGTFESNLPGTGLLIYRINNLISNGNSQGPPDEVYLYRPNGTAANNDGNSYNANFNSTNGRSIFNSTSNPNSFLSNGSIENFAIKNITVTGNSVSFDVRLCTNTDVTITNTSQLPEVTNAVNKVQTSGSVIVKSTDKITFEAGQEILLNSGFETQVGCQLDLNIINCGN